MSKDKQSNSSESCIKTLQTWMKTYSVLFMYITGIVKEWTEYKRTTKTQAKISINKLKTTIVKKFSIATMPVSFDNDDC